MSLLTDVEEYRFADRFVAARSWALAARLVERNPELIVSALVAPDRVPLLICHTPDEITRIQFDMVAWILFGPLEGPHTHLYWDEAFAHDLLWSIRHIEAACRLIPSPQSTTPRGVTYATIASLLAAGVDDEDTWQVRPVPVMAQSGGDGEVLGLFPGGPAALDAILRTASDQLTDPPSLVHEPLWALWHAGEPVLLLDSSTGIAHLRTGGQIDLVGASATSTPAQCVAHVFAQLPELRATLAEVWQQSATPVSGEDLGLSGDWSLADMVTALDRFTSAAKPQDLAPAAPAWWARAVWAVAQDAAAGASFERIVSHREMPSALVAPIWEPLTRPAPRVDAVEERDIVPGPPAIGGEIELHPIAPWIVEAQIWQLATDLEQRCAGLQIAPGAGDGELLRLVDDLGATVAVLSDEGVRSAGGLAGDLADWWDVFTAELPGTLADDLAGTLGDGSDGSPSRLTSTSANPAHDVHRWIAHVLATQVHDDEPWSALAAHHPLHGTAWVLRRGARVMAVADEATATLLSRGEPLALSGPARRPTEAAWAALEAGALVDDGPQVAPKSVTLWDAHGLHVWARRTVEGVVIQGQDHSAGGQHEHEYTIEVTDVEPLEQALGGEVMARLERRGAEIVAAGESTWLSQHAVEHVVVDDDASTASGNPVRGDLTYYGKYSERFGILAAYAVYSWPPGPADDTHGWPPRQPDAPYRQAFRWSGSTWRPLSFADLETALDDYDALSAAITREDLARDWPDAAATPLSVVTGSPEAQVAKAEALAAEAHSGQTDKNGDEYLLHPAAVAGAFDPRSEPVECAAAWLHDVVEDTGVDFDELRGLDIQEPVLEVVELLTRTAGVSNEVYYARIAAHPAARRVKLADIAHNTRPDRVARLDDMTRARLATKYTKALAALGVPQDTLVGDGGETVNGLDATTVRVADRPSTQEKTMHLTAMHLDRAVGVLLGGAAGDALGAAYEFGGPLTHDHPVDMSGGGQLGWEPGEWTDDTSMAIAIARLLADGRPLSSEATLDSLVEAWKGWSAGAKDVGVQISTVLRSLRVSTAAAARDAARALHELTGRSAGNGSLMRTGPVALAYLDDGQEQALADAARAVSALTHWETDAGDACVLWSLAIRHAVRTGELDLTGQLAYLPEERRERWAGLIDEAEKSRPRDFSKNGWTVEALQGAWSAIHHGTGLVDTLERAVRGGHDTDTVAAIAGALAGAVHGGSAVPARWRQVLHGWPGIGVRDLTDLAVLAARGGHPDRTGWPTIDRYPPSPEDVLIPHPLDDGVLLASLAGLDRLPPDVELVVSLCRIGRHQTDRTHVEFWLVDQPGSNLDTQFVLLDAADMIARERAAGRRVAVHCFEARSRTAAAAATYAVRHLGIGLDETWTALHQARPAFDPQPFLVDAVAAIALQLGADRSDPDARPDQGQLAATADQEDQGGSRAAGQDQAPPASRFVIAQSWWIGSEIARRNNLELYEMHPGGGQYDVLAVMARVPEVGAPPLLQMNRAGSVHLRQHHWMNWADVLAQVDPHFVVRAAESGLDLDPPHVAATSPRSLTYRVIARVLATLVDDRHAWDARMGHLDSSSDEDEDEERLDEINLRVPLAIEHIRRIAPTHDFGEPGRHLWTLRRGRDDDAYATDLVAVLCDDGHVFLPGAHAPTDLMALYNANRRRLGPTVHAALGSVLP